MKKKVTFLGTGTSQGVPMIGCHCEVCTSEDPRDSRLRTSLMIEADGVRVVIDAGPDFRGQMLHHKVEDIDAILLTHEHRDHTGGLDEVRSINYFKRHDMPIYCTARTAEAMRRDYAYAFGENRYPGAPMLTLIEIDSMEDFSVGGLQFTPVYGSHSFLPVVGYRFGDAAYLTDFKSIEDDEVEKLKGVRTLILNALRHTPHPSHFSLSEAITIAERVAPERVYFTHFCHEIGLYSKIEPTLPEGMHMAYDGLTIEI